MTKAPLSPETGKPMVRGFRALVVSYKGQARSINMPGWYCADSDEGIHSGDDLKVSDTALRNLKIEAENLLTPEDVKKIRLKMGLTQRQAGQIIGGGPNAFQKYEAGTTMVSKGISNFLRVLERHPEEIEELKKQA